MLDIGAYRRYLTEFVKEAIQNSDGTNSGISNYLHEKKIKGLLVRHRVEQQRALEDAQKAFDEHHYWPVEIVISHLGVELNESKTG
jgi:hypothetical protein